MRATEHFVQFYEADAFLLDSVGDFAGSALRAGDAAVIVATRAHRDGIAARLRDQGIDLAAARGAGRFVSLDAAELLSQFMVDGTPDPPRFTQIVGEILGRAADGSRSVRVFGELVALLAVARNHTGAVRLEQLWNELALTHSFSLFCGYSMDGFTDDTLAEVFANVCAEHSRVVPDESYTALTTPDDQLRAVALWQQKARRLEAAVAERERTEERLQVALAAERAARQAAEDALRLRDEFISVAAHELKTPVTSLQGFAQLLHRRIVLGQGLDPDRSLKVLTEITGQTGRLTRLLNQLFDVSRLESGKLALQPEPTELAALVVQLGENAQARTSRHTISLSVPPVLTARVDPLRLEQVLTNLLDNAVKYSPDGGAIEVVLRLAGLNEAELSVRDHGLGIPPERREQVFDRFFQAHTQGHWAGLGLGLYISRQIVEQHGGEIWAEFPDDGGARFVVRLPLGVEEQAGPCRGPAYEETAVALRQV